MDTVYLNWSDFKLEISNKVKIRYWERETFYKIIYFDDVSTFETSVMKDGGADQVDFDDNYKPYANKKFELLKNSVGLPIQAPTFEDALGLTAAWEGYLYETTPETLNIYDEVVTSQLKLRGGWYETLNDPGISPAAVKNDYVEFSVVDKDDVLGLFSQYGLTPGVDVLELGKFVRKEYVNPYAYNKRQQFQASTAFEVIPGLYFRTYYYSTGLQVVNFKVNINYYEV